MTNNNIIERLRSARDGDITIPLSSDEYSYLFKAMKILDRKENLLERIRVKAMQTGWMDHLKEALGSQSPASKEAGMGEGN